MNTTAISNLLRVLKTKNRLGILISFISFVLLTNIATMKLVYAKGLLKVTDIENPILDIVCDGDITFYTAIPSLMLHKEYEVSNVIAYASDELITESLK